MNEIKFPHIPKSSPRYKRYVIDNPIKKRFFEKVEKTNKCWNWIGSKRVQKNPLNNYGQFAINRKIQSSHRISWMLNKGRIPKGMCVLHKCDNIICVRPSHLYIGTQKENGRDKAKRGRAPKGIDLPCSKLNNEAVKFIKTNHKQVSIRQLSEKFGVDYCTVAAVLDGRTWKHIKV